MKTKSTILTLATAVIGLAFIASSANARPPSKSHGLPSLKKRAESSAPTTTTDGPKSVSLKAASDAKVHFNRKMGGHGRTHTHRVMQTARSQGAESAGGHFHSKIGGRQSRGSHN